MVTSSLDALGLARAVGPEVDRLFIAGHRAAAPLARPIRDRFQLQSFGLLIDLRKLLLAPAGMSMEDALALERYQPRERVTDQLQGHVDEGLVQRDDGAFLPTERGRDLLLALTDAQEAAVSELWSGQESNIADVSRLLPRTVERAAATLPPHLYPAFTAERQGFTPDDAPPAFTVWSLLSTLRYLRADAHELAWREAALSAAQIRAATALWQGPGRPLEHLAESLTGVSADEVIEELRRRGWARATSAGWVLTEAGRERREHIEFRTNALSASPFAALEPEERDRLLARLRAFPDASS